MSVSACAVALVLLLDASGSIDGPSWDTQTGATADALVSGPVLRAVEAGGGVAVVAVGFSDEPDLMLPWSVLRGREDAEAFAAALRSAPRPPGAYTDIAGAIDAGLVALGQAPCAPERSVIDLSTDGKANPWMPAASEARDRAHAAGVTVNAIGVGGDEVPGWLRDNAVTPGGFVVESAAWADYARGIRRKIASEVASR